MKQLLCDNVIDLHRPRHMFGYLHNHICNGITYCVYKAEHGLALRD